MSHTLYSVKHYINGNWVEEQGAKTTPLYNPSTGEQIGAVPSASNDLSLEAIRTAHEAYMTWKDMSLSKRMGFIFKMRELMERDAEKLAVSIAIDQAKHISEARGEVGRVIEILETAASVPTLIQGEAIEHIASNISGRVVRQPLGVFAGVAPFNFPALVFGWFIPFAIATGNTFIFKPSTQSPLFMQGMCAIFDEMEWRGDRLLPFYLALLEDPKDVLLRQNLLGHFWDVPTLDTEPFINHIRKLVDTGALEHAELGLSSVCAGILLGLGQKEDVVRVKRLGYDEQGHFVNEMRQRLEQEYHGKETPVSARKRKKEQRIAELQRQRTANDRPTMSAVSKGVPPVRTDSSATDPSGILLYLGVGLLVLAALQAVLKVLWR